MRPCPVHSIGASTNWSSNSHKVPPSNAINATNLTSAFDDDTEDVFTINQEQREYYERQFKSLGIHLINGKLTGKVAKEFFEKSRLPVEELSKIWHLVDVDRDGQLGLNEFCSAMHLVVLRRNGIPLPEFLPLTLLPQGVPINSPPNHLSVPSSLARQKPSSAPPPPTDELNFISLPINVNASVSSVSNKSNWQRFSPPPASKPSSEGLQVKPKASSAKWSGEEPILARPIPRRISPDGQAVPYRAPFDPHAQVFDPKKNFFQPLKDEIQ